MMVKDISRKLLKSNFKDYIILLLSLSFSLGVVICSGMMITSPTVTDVLYPGGASQRIATVMYVLLFFGTSIFIIYSIRNLFKVKSRELGILIVLGSSSRLVKNIYRLHIVIVICLSAIIGTFLSIFLLFVVIKCMHIFSPSSELYFSYGIGGFYLGGLAFILIVLMIVLYTSHYLKKYNIMDVLLESSSSEKVKLGQKPLYIIWGITIIVISVVAIALGARPIPYRNTTYILLGIVLSVLGFYLVIIQLACFGDVIKRISIRAFNRNSVFWGILKLKGRQYTMTIFTSIILTMVGIYLLISTVGPIVERGLIIENAPYDFEYVNIPNKEVDKKEVYKLASTYSIDITQFNILEGIVLTEVYSYERKGITRTEYGEDSFFVSEREFNRLFKESIDVHKDKYVLVLDDPQNHVFVELLYPDRVYTPQFYNIAREEIVDMTAQDVKIIGKAMPKTPYLHGKIRILDDDNYMELRNKTDNQYVYSLNMFQVKNYEETYEFSKAFNKAFLEAHNMLYDPYIHYSGRRVLLEEKVETLEVNDISAEMRRNWSIMPFSKAFSLHTYVNNYIVYLALFILIAITCILLSGAISVLKVWNMCSDNKELFKNLDYIGTSRAYKKRLMKCQVRVIFLIPNVISVLFSSLVYLLMNLESLEYFKEVAEITCRITLVIFMIILGLYYVVNQILSKLTLD